MKYPRRFASEINSRKAVAFLAQSCILNTSTTKTEQMRMQKLTSLVEFPHIIDCYKFETAKDCDDFVSQSRLKGVWAYKDGSRGQHPNSCTFACVRNVSAAADMVLR